MEATSVLAEDGASADLLACTLHHYIVVG
jgi:hypothetical protein